MNDDATADDSGTSNSRRAFLRKAAVAGGVAWATPVIMSQPAAAQGSLPHFTATFVGGPTVVLQTPCGFLTITFPNATDVTGTPGSLSLTIVRIGDTAEPNPSQVPAIGTSAPGQEVTATFTAASGNYFVDYLCAP